MDGKSKDQQEKLKQQDEMRQAMINQILDSTAKERLTRISMVKPEKGRAVEELLIRMAQGGQISGKVDEKQLIQFLERISEQEKKMETKIQFKHRGDEEDDDWEENLFKD